MARLGIGDIVQTLYTPSQQGRTVCFPTGSVGRITEKYYGNWIVEFDLPLLTSSGDLFFYTEEKETIGGGYQPHELRHIDDATLSHSILVWLVSEEEHVHIYDVSRWEGLLDLSLQDTLETSCSKLISTTKDPYERGSALSQSLIYCFEQGYAVQNFHKLVTKEMLQKSIIWNFQCYIMDKERPFEHALAGDYHPKERTAIEAQLLPYQELAYLFMEASDEIKTKNPTFANQLAVLDGRTQALESVCCFLKKEAQEQTLERLRMYYRTRSVLSNWKHLCRKEKK